MSADVLSSPETFIKPPGKVYVMYLMGKVKASFWGNFGVSWFMVGPNIFVSCFITWITIVHHTTKLQACTLWVEFKRKSSPTIKSRTLMGPKAAQLTKKKLITSNHGLRFLGQTLCFKWGENISIGSLTIVFFKASSVIFLPSPSSWKLYDE